MFPDLNSRSTPAPPAWSRFSRCPCLFKNEALNITVVSYDGNLNFSFTACRTSLPRVQDVAVYTLAALEQLEEAVRDSGQRTPGQEG
ncbi:WS/DGAT domain-containing protein [Nocardia sp. CA-107356]|uniref:WS/DGAT domain-containing protein n=1 Tax=Nocardia sp. CA-107356 TaxID=3239972 RepID=UPI003D8D6A20